MSENSVKVAEILSTLGVDKKKALDLQNHMNGVDFLNLVNALDDDTSNGRKTALEILAKYGIKIHKVPQMDNTRLESIFDGVRAGKDFDEAAEMQFVRPIDEMESIAAKMSGYSNFVRAANDADAETLRDWLEENEFEYQNNDKLTFLVQSEDREKAYRLNRFMSKLNGKTSVMDSVNPREEYANKNLKKIGFKGQVGSKLSSKRGPLTVWDGLSISDSGLRDHMVVAKDARGHMHKIPVNTANATLHVEKDIEETKMTEKKFSKNIKVDAPATRNPIAAGIAKKSGGGIHTDKSKKRDVWDRTAKHKKVQVDENAFTQGETVQFEGNECSVHIPAGPNGTVGLLIDGKVRMVRESEVERIDEGVLGMTKVDPLYRLRELAGVKSNEAPIFAKDELDNEVDQLADLEVADDFDDADLGMDNEVDPSLDMPMDDGMGDEFAGDDLGGDLDGDFAGDMGGVPGDLPPMGSDDAIGVVPSDSEAYTQIQDHLNNIQNSLGDVKLSEYRSLIAKLEALAIQVRSMGRDYLGEARKLKK